MKINIIFWSLLFFCKAEKDSHRDTLLRKTKEGLHTKKES